MYMYILRVYVHVDVMYVIVLHVQTVYDTIILCNN